MPDEISLVGFDDLPGSQYMIPPLTTIRQPIYTMGLTATHAIKDGDAVDVVRSDGGMLVQNLKYGDEYGAFDIPATAVSIAVAFECLRGHGRSAHRLASSASLAPAGSATLEGQPDGRFGRSTALHAADPSARDP